MPVAQQLFSAQSFPSPATLAAWLWAKPRLSLCKYHQQLAAACPTHDDRGGKGVAQLETCTPPPEEATLGQCFSMQEEQATRRSAGYTQCGAEAGGRTERFIVAGMPWPPG